MGFEIAEELVLGLMSVSFDREFVFVRGIVGGGLQIAEDLVLELMSVSFH